MMCSWLFQIRKPFQQFYFAFSELCFCLGVDWVEPHSWRESCTCWFLILLFRRHIGLVHIQSAPWWAIYGFELWMRWLLVRGRGNLWGRQVRRKVSRLARLDNDGTSTCKPTFDMPCCFSKEFSFWIVTISCCCGDGVSWVAGEWVGEGGAIFLLFLVDVESSLTWITLSRLVTLLRFCSDRMDRVFLDGCMASRDKRILFSLSCPQGQFQYLKIDSHYCSHRGPKFYGKCSKKSWL